mgnify:CR=1 FL=1
MNGQCQILALSQVVYIHQYLKFYLREAKKLILPTGLNTNGSQLATDQ